MSTDHLSTQPWVLTQVTVVISKSDLDPEEVTRRLSLTPTDVLQPGTDARYPDGEWRLKFGDRISRDFSQQLDAALLALDPQRSTLHDLVSEGCEVLLTAYGFADHNSTIELAARDVERISQLGIPFALIPNINSR
ncbi:DUF4279 domain-containing protein [Streptomyces sioyaensis]|uniref:DUF4279 domain-containing protein n=1 Tax=Streptomyces sioyaensis TaxID=67364 RepID=UPI0036839AB4